MGFIGIGHIFFVSLFFVFLFLFFPFLSGIIRPRINDMINYCISVYFPFIINPVLVSIFKFFFIPLRSGYNARGKTIKGNFFGNGEVFCRNLLSFLLVTCIFHFKLKQVFLLHFRVSKIDDNKGIMFSFCQCDFIIL